MSKIIDLTGQKFGKLTVLELDINNPKSGAYWICKCECGNTKIARGSSLRNGTTTHCGCSIPKRPYAIDKTSLIGQRFGRLIVIERDLTKTIGHGEDSYWICQCDCGNKISVGRTSLGRHTNSCGCLKKEMLHEKNTLDLTGQRFGKIVAIERTNEKSHGSFLWKCKCDCGNEKLISAENLRSGKVNSCGCISSKGEMRIQQILQENHILYRKEQTFNDLRSDKNVLLRYDFALLDDNNNIIRLVEYDGEQHFKTDTKFSSPLVQYHDNKKNQYAKEHDIPLVRIPYTEYNNLSLNIILGEQFLI